MLTAEQNERLSRVGPGTPCGELMRRYWHPIAASSQLAEPGTRQVRILGEDLVLYRDRQGGLGLLEPHCAHRGAGLLFGQPDQNGLRCTYHGWMYDSSGQCTEQPYEKFVDPDTTFKDRIRLKAYPLEELGGLIFAYLGPEPRPLLPRWEAYVRDGVKREIGMAVIPCNWLQTVENHGDSTHTVYTHWHFSAFVLEKLGRTDIRRLAGAGATGFTTEMMSRDRLGGNDGIFPYVDCQQDCYQIRVPMDDTHTLHFWYMTFTAEDEKQFGIEVPAQDKPWSIPVFEVPVPGLDERGQPQWPLLDNNSGQDMVMWYSQGPIADRTREHLGHGDELLIERRRLLEEQIQLVEDGEDPINTFRDPAENQCLVPHQLTRMPAKLRADGSLERTNAARKYSSWYRAAFVKRYGAERLADPVV